MLPTHVWIRRKAPEFGQAESRMTGVACRLLYLHTMWRAIAATKQTTPPSNDASSEQSASPRRPKVVVDANGYAPFHDEIVRACELMDCDVIDQAAQDPHALAQAQLVFVYVSPHGEERVENQYATFQAITAYHKDHATPADARPLFCFLLGEAAFLEPPANAEAERLRGLSGFAISQRFTPLLSEASYESIAQFAVEYTPAVLPVTRDDMSDLMSRFGCMDHNIMHDVEKWGFYGFAESSFLVHDKDEDQEDGNGVTTASEDEVRYWLEFAQTRACNQCHTWQEKLLRCGRCGHAWYCSRDCQKTAWKLHKRLCGKSDDQIRAESAAADAAAASTT
jgi:hypothetical protein